MCLTCDLRAEHGGQLGDEVLTLSFYLFDTPVTLAYWCQWQDPNGDMWWVGVLGPEGQTPPPLTERARAFRLVRVDVVMPLFATSGAVEDALHGAIRSGATII